MIIGVHTGVQDTSPAELVDLWRRLEKWGFGWISVWDHFYGTTRESGSLEAVAAHTALALTTSHVRCGSLVYCVGYRHPAVLANAIATIDQVSAGRVTLGLGAGWHKREFEAYGIPFPSARTRLRQLEEAIQCIRLLLTRDVADFDGEFFQLRAARCAPKPVQKRLPIWLGGLGERVTLRLVAQYADGWNAPFLDLNAFRHKSSVLDGHCADVARDPSEITRSVNVPFARSRQDHRAQFGAAAELSQAALLTGSPAHMTERLMEYASAGADQVNLAIRAPFNLQSLEGFASDVLPELNRLLGR